MPQLDRITDAGIEGAHRSTVGANNAHEAAIKLTVDPTRTRLRLLPWRSR